MGRDQLRQGELGVQFDRPSTVGKDEFVVRALIVLGLFWLLAATVLLIWYAADVLLLAFAGILLGVLLRGLAMLVSRVAGLSVGWSLGLGLVVMAALIGAGGWLLAAKVVGQLDDLSRSLMASVARLREDLQQFEWVKPYLESPGQGLVSGGGAVLGRVSQFFSGAFGMIADLVIILFVGLYTAADPATYRGGLIKLVPPDHRRRAGEILDTLGNTLRRWLLGRLANMTFVGVATTIGLWLLSVPMAILLGLIAFFLDFVPYLGPIVSAVPAILVALPSGPMQAVYVGLLYFSVQSAESYVTMPLVQRSTVQLPPAVIVLAQVLLGVLAGGLGLALATPVAAVLLVLVRKLYIEDVLGDAVGEGSSGEDASWSGSAARAVRPSASVQAIP